MKKNELKSNIKLGYLTLQDSFHKTYPNGRKRLYWHCFCDCGQIVERDHGYLTDIYNGKDKSHPSCGCQHSQCMKGDKGHTWTGCGDLSGQYYASLKCRARGKKITKNRPQGIEFNISIEYLWNLFLKQNKKCALTGLPITLTQSRKSEAQTGSVDRINNDKGYIEGNVRWVHKDINKMRGFHSDQQFIEYCKLVVQHNP